MFIIYRQGSRNELFYYHGTSGYIYIDDDTHSKGEWTIVGGVLGIASSMFFLVFEMVLLKIQDHRAFFGGYLKVGLILFYLSLSSWIPPVLNKMLIQYQSRDTLCSYNNTSFENANKIYFGILGGIGLLTYIITKIFSSWFYDDIQKKVKKMDKIKSEILISKVAVLLTGAYFSMSNSSCGFINSFVILSLYVPIKRWYGFKFLLMIPLFLIVLGFLYLLEPERVLSSFAKSVRFSACYGYSSYLNYGLVYFGIVVNYFYRQIKYVFLI